MDLRPILYIIGIFLCVLAVFMVIPIACDFYTNNPDWIGFSLSMGICSFTGIMLILANKQKKIEISGRQAFALTGFSWCALSVFAAIPFLLANPNISFADAVFESVSGLTTTGATIFFNLDHMPNGILIWRALLQWLGGIGIIVMAISILPFLKVGGMQLFRLESSEKEKILPRLNDMTKALFLAYTAISLACYIAYLYAGMTPFEAAVHSMSTMSTGGFSTTDNSFANFTIMAKIFSIIFMIFAAMPFIIFLKMFYRSFTSIFDDDQILLFLKLQAFFIVFMVVYVAYQPGVHTTEDLVNAAFNIISVSTGTGFAASDYNLLPPLALGFILFASCIGGCAGSASCGIKIFRFQILYRVAKNQMLQLLYPNGVFTITYNKQPLTVNIAASVMAFFFIFVLSLALISMALMACGLDMVTSISGAVASLSNVGPGLGNIIGPAGNYSSLPDSAIWILTASMLLGRLEFFTLLIFFVPRFWRG